MEIKMISQKEKVFISVQQTMLQQLAVEIKEMVTTSQIKGFINNKIELLEGKLNE